MFVREGDRSSWNSDGMRAVPRHTPHVRRDRPRAVLGSSVDVSRSTGLPHP